MFLMFLSCGQVDQEKPENLIGEEKMADLISSLRYLMPVRPL